MSRKYQLIQDQERPHVALFGPFVGSMWLRTMAPPPDIGVPTIFMTGENVSPDMARCDFAVSFCRDIVGNNHLRIPEWVFKLYDVGASPTDLLHANRRIVVERPRFCAFLARNSVDIREKFVDILSRRWRVDCPSASLNNLPPIGPSHNEKIDFLKNYRFNIAFENAQANGYTTEKLPDALLVGTVPIYWGDPEVGLDFNKRCFLDLSDFASMEDLADEIGRIDQSLEVRSSMLNEPAFVNDVLPECAQEERLFAFFDSIFESVI